MKQIIYNQLEEHRLAGWLVFSAMRMEALADRFMLKPLGLTNASFRILMALEKLGPQAPSEMIELLGSSKSNVTQRFNFLVKHDLIKLDRHVSVDKRRVSAQITALGRKKLAQAKLMFAEKHLHIEKYFNDKEMQDFLRLLRQLNAGLDQCEMSIKTYYEKK